MPKGRKANRNGGDSIAFPFHTVVQGALTAGVLTLNATPTALSSRALLEADAWAHFRIQRLAFRLLPASTTASNSSQVIGFVGGMQDTPPSTFAAVGELLPCVALGADQTVPSEWVNVPKSDLAGPFPWYKALPGTADTTEESPGQIVIASSSSSTDVVCYEIRGIFVFKTSVATANTPLALEARRRIREERLAIAKKNERDVLLRIIATPATLAPRV